MNKIITPCLPFLFIACCQPTSDKTIDGEFKIFLLQDSTITAGNAFSQPIESLTLNNSAFLTVAD